MLMPVETLSNTPTEAPRPATSEFILPSVKGAYGLEAADIQLFGRGLVNQTYKVHQADNVRLLQRMSDVLEPSVADDAAVIGEHLEKLNWEAPLPLPSVNGQRHFTDEHGQTWRLLKWIDSDNSTPADSSQLLEAAGDMLGRWHRDVVQLRYTPNHTIPHFHETQYYAQKLGRFILTLPATETRELARETLSVFTESTGDYPDTPQLIHGDPKLDNMLFREGLPFTLIDFDTVMIGSPWIDVGDFLRSVTARRIKSGQEITAESLVPFIDAYAAATGQSADGKTQSKAFAATHRISTELAMRYLCDIKEANYFNWDDTQYESRQENHQARAKLQLAVAASAVALMRET